MSLEDKKIRIYNSSNTRVEPAFDLIRREQSWQKFFDLVRKKSQGGVSGCCTLPIWMGADMDVDVRYGAKDSESGGEMALAPQKDLLLWLVDNIGKSDDLNPVKADAGKERCELSERNVKRIKEARDTIVQCAQAIEQSAKEGKYPRSWCVLEGATKPDVYIKTDNFILLIEGKRTEAGFTRHTTWMKRRDQMIRHMDSCYPLEGSPRLPVFGLYIVSDENDPVFVSGKRRFPKWETRIGWYHNLENWKRSLPHRTKGGCSSKIQVIEKMQRHFLGYITWNDLSSVFPDVKCDQRWK